MASEPILCICIWFIVTSDAMLNLDSEFDVDENLDVTCKHSFKTVQKKSIGEIKYKIFIRNVRRDAGQAHTYSSFSNMMLEITVFLKEEMDIMHCYFDCTFVFQVHSNETIGSVRQRIANKLKYKSDQIQIVVNDKMVSNISFICSELIVYQSS